ncbi:hypothetical protein BH24BAC1_BH24BAC1_38920 [soil metagenome]
MITTYTLTVTDGGSCAKTVTLTGSSVTGIEETNKFGLAVFPNEVAAPRAATAFSWHSSKAFAVA